MFQRKPRGFRRRSNGRGRGSHENGFMQSRQRSNSFSNNQIRNNFRHTQSAEKLFEKYTALAKEAMSSGDKTLGENYLQHADHFIRILEDKNKNRDQNKVETTNKSLPDQKSSLEDSNIKQEDSIKNKE
tara:strand:+ start:565 stop:951 length:387 start_codon:yes stop_codon:yes gene_type:complete